MPQRLTPDQALQRLQRYCSLEDRSHHQVRQKLYDYQVYGSDQEEIIADLISDKFLDEERFARSYVRGKFSMKAWGRLRLIQGLREHRISSYCIDRGLEEIDPQAYRDMLRHILRKKRPLIRESDPWRLRRRLLSYAHQKGYEPALIRELLEDIISSD